MKIIKNRLWSKQILTYREKIAWIKKDAMKEIFLYAVILLVIVWIIFLADIYRLMKGVGWF